ncbi:hypothetical protein D9M70_529920 [compost metagenome]
MPIGACSRSPRRRPSDCGWRNVWRRSSIEPEGEASTTQRRGSLLKDRGLNPQSHNVALRGITNEISIFSIP